jgi:hypothetical protein
LMSFFHFYEKYFFFGRKECAITPEKTFSTIYRVYQ